MSALRCITFYVYVKVIDVFGGEVPHSDMEFSYTIF